MKKLILCLCISVLLFGGLFSVSAQSHADEVVFEAMSISMGAYFMAAMMAGFGQAPEGVVLDESTGKVTFTRFSLADMSETYTHISGNVSGSEEEGIKVDCTLEGGAVSSIRYSMSNEDMETQPEEMTVFADEKKYVIPVGEMSQ